MPLNWKLLLAVGVEILYMISTRSWLNEFADGIELELYITGVRLLTAAIYWALFRDIILHRPVRNVSFQSPMLWIGIGAVCLVPILVGNWGLSGYKTQFVFALTSIAVGIREEILYRGVLQTLIEKRLGWIWAIVLSNVVFTLYHYGAWEFTTSKVLELFFVGCFLGLLYRGTGSLIIAIVFHSIYDAIWCFTPYMEKPWHWAWGSVMQILAAALIFFWVLSLISPNKKMQLD